MIIKTAKYEINFTSEARDLNKNAPSLGVKMMFEVEYRAIKNGSKFGRRFWRYFETEAERDDFITDLVTA